MAGFRFLVIKREVLVASVSFSVLSFSQRKTRGLSKVPRRAIQMTFERDVVTDVVRYDGIHKVVENVYEVAKSGIMKDATWRMLSSRVTHYTKGNVSAKVIEFPTKCHVGRNNAEMIPRAADGSYLKTRTYKDVSNAHAKAIEYVLESQ